MSDITNATRKDGVIININLEKCISAGPCAIAASKVFLTRADGKAVIGDPDGNTLEEVTEAVNSCPVLAITLLKDGVKIAPKE